MSKKIAEGTKVLPRTCSNAFPVRRPAKRWAMLLLGGTGRVRNVWYRDARCRAEGGRYYPRYGITLRVQYAMSGTGMPHTSYGTMRTLRGSQAIRSTKSAHAGTIRGTETAYARTET
eukprot:645219-Rhodomonas_salina.1